MKKYLIFFTILLISNELNAQARKCVMNGLVEVCQSSENTETYSLGTCSDCKDFVWTITGGSRQSAQGNNWVYVLWNTPGEGKVSVTMNCPYQEPDGGTGYQYTTSNKFVTIYPQLSKPDANDKFLCGAGFATLSVINPDPTYTYSWRDALGQQLGTGTSYTTGNLTASTHYRVRASNSSCFSEEEIVYVTVYDEPMTYTVYAPNNGTYCQGDGGTTITLSGSQTNFNYTLRGVGDVSGVTKPGTGATISWSKITVEKEYGIYVVEGNCEYQMNSTVMVSQLPLPSVNAGPDIVAFPGNAVTLNGQSPTGGTWSGTGVSGTSFSRPTPGTYTVKYSYTDDNSCSNSDTRVITLLSAPVIQYVGGDVLNVCEGSVTIAVATGYHGYQWYRNGQLLSEKTGFQLIVTESGSYYVEVTTTDGYKTTSNPIVINTILASSDMNYLMSWDLKVPIVTEANIPFDVDRIDRRIEYFDGLGRQIQSIAVQNSPEEGDIIQPIAYDDFGRSAKEYLPYVSCTGGLYEPEAIDPDPNNYPANSRQYDFYQTTDDIALDTQPFSGKIFESSPLNRIKEQFGAGHEWSVNSKRIIYHYCVNDVNDNVKNWDIVSEMLQSSLYNPGQLTKTITTDEESHQTIEFVDKLGQTILKRVQVHQPGATTEEWADTYYIYDDFGNLRFVLPPMANEKLDGGATIDDTFLAQWAFCYKYDGRNRMIEKRVPGADWVYMVYDNRDRLVLTQDGNQRDGKNEWTFTKYDQLNRPIATGIVDKGAMEVADIRIEVGGITNFYETRGTTVHGYTDQSYPTGVAANNYLTVTYYDDYTFKSLPDFGTAYDYSVPTQLGSQTTPQGTYTFPSAEFDRVKGQVTGSKTKVLDNTNTWLSTVTYYDDRYRVIQTVTENYSGGIDRFSTLHNFPGWMLATYTSHQKGTDTYGIKKRYTYDHAGRLMQGYHQLFKNGTGQGEVLLAENKYNELGELIEKNLHVENNQPHQSVDYRYNIRGWLESVNNSNLQIETGINEDDARPDLFGMELLYNHPLNGVPAGN